MNKKTVYILHGWPQAITSDSMYFKYFSRREYNVIAPNLYLENFSINETQLITSLLSKLNGKTPDVILGISMGGLLAPHIAQKYPKSKLILIATGPVLESNSIGFNVLFRLINIPIFQSIFNLFRYIPRNLIYQIYKIFNPVRDISLHEEYIIDMKTNVDVMLSVPVKKHAEIAQFISRVDNTHMLQNLHNKTVIFSGQNDSMMPNKLGNLLGELIHNSQVIVTKGSHFNVFNGKNFSDVSKFLRS